MGVENLLRGYGCENNALYSVEEEKYVGLEIKKMDSNDSDVFKVENNNIVK